MQERMYGVVLWSDAFDQKAVIWCEDHGDLAYYAGGAQTAHGGVSLDPGDLIEFDLDNHRDYRAACNLAHVCTHYAAGLPDAVRRRGRTQGDCAAGRAADASGGGGTLVDFDRARRRA
jgi:hypothetical protein